MEPQVSITVALPVLSLLCEALFYLCFVLLLNNGRAVNRSCLALWFPREDRKAWPPPSPCSCPCQGSGVQQELSWVRRGLGAWGRGLDPAVALVPVPLQSSALAPTGGTPRPSELGVPVQPRVPLRAAFAPGASLSSSASKNVPFSLISATSLFPRVKYFGEQSVFGFGARGRFESRPWLVPEHWGYAMALTGGQVEGPFSSTPNTIWDLLHSTRGWLDELAQAGLVAPALRARGPRMFAWSLGAVSWLWIPFLLQAGSWMCLERIKSCPGTAP